MNWNDASLSFSEGIKILWRFLGIISLSVIKKENSVRKKKKAFQRNVKQVEREISDERVTDTDREVKAVTNAEMTYSLPPFISLTVHTKIKMKNKKDMFLKEEDCIEKTCGTSMNKRACYLKQNMQPIFIVLS